MGRERERERMNGPLDALEIARRDELESRRKTIHQAAPGEGGQRWSSPQRISVLIYVC